MGEILTKRLIKEKMSKINDFIIDDIVNEELIVTLYYLKTMVNQQRVEQFIKLPIREMNKKMTIEEIGISPIKRIENDEQFELEVFTGCVIIYVNGEFYAAKAESTLSRGIQSSDVEDIIYGPRDAFTESIDSNVTLIRRRLPIAELKCEYLTVGKMSKTLVNLMYVEGIVDEDVVQRMKEKIQQIKNDMILDTSYIGHLLDENVNSLFPEFQKTDRPDATASALASGKVVILSNNSPFVLIAPASFFDFFQSPEDYINKWLIASTLRVMRFIAYLISFTFTPLYVAVMTHHYNMIPIQLIPVVLTQRSHLPFSPFFEALVLIVPLEIIREASLRMPSKTGQTLGIIGGIVIGQAAVDAGIASNVLLICVSVSMISSFLVPNYLMSVSGRFFQIMFLVLANFFGFIGVTMGLLAVMIHLNKMNSMQKPYLSPLAPAIPKDWRDVIIRIPTKYLTKVPKYTNTKERGD